MVNHYDPGHWGSGSSMGWNFLVHSGGNWDPATGQLEQKQYSVEQANLHNSLKPEQKDVFIAKTA